MTDGMSWVLAISSADRADLVQALLMVLLVAAGLSILIRLAHKYVFVGKPIPPDKVDDRSVDGLDLVAGFVGAFMLPLSLLGILVGPDVSSDMAPVAAAHLFAAAVLVAYILVRSRTGSFWGDPRRMGRHVWSAAKALLAVYPILLAVGFFAGWLVELITGNPVEMQNVVRPFLEAKQDHRSLVLMTLYALVGAPVLEEVVFRGVMLRYIRKKMTEGGWTKAFFPGLPVLVSAAIFGLVHGQPVPMAVTAVLGVVLGVVLEKTGSVFPCILLHMMFNGISLVIIFHQRLVGA